jgi:hypothetical protein
MTPQDLGRHAALLWEMLVAYAQDEGIDKDTTGILILRTTSPDEKAGLLVVRFAGDAREAVKTLGKAAIEIMPQSAQAGKKL